jgi:hypothetical protein
MEPWLEGGGVGLGHEAARGLVTVPQTVVPDGDRTGAQLMATPVTAAVRQPRR